MAKKRKGPKRKGGRRVGGVKQNAKTALMGLVGATLGVVAGRLLNNSISTMDGKLVGAGELLVGGALVVKGKSILVKGIGAGLGANGVLYGLGSKGLNVLPASMGYGPPMQQGYRAMNGYRDVPKIGFPKPGNIGRVQPSNMEMARMARMYAGVYN